MRAALLAAAVAVGFAVPDAGGSPRPQPGPAAPVQCEFRVFDGEHEVTAETTLRVFPSGKREEGGVLGPAERLRTALAPGLYDVQAIRQQHGQVVRIKWAERLVVMHYPDEEGLHLEVINFSDGYGALQIRAAPGTTLDADAVELRARRRGEATGTAPRAAPGISPDSAGKTVRGDGYVLLVAPAGSYDVHLRPKDPKKKPFDDLWLLQITLTADSTRLKTVQLGDRKVTGR